MTVDELRTYLLRERGDVTLEVTDAIESSGIKAADEFTRKVKLSPPHDDSYWTSLPTTLAKRHLVNCIAYDLAYNSEVIPTQDAERVAQEVFDLLLQPPKLCVTNMLPWEPAIYENRDRMEAASAAREFKYTDADAGATGWPRKHCGMSVVVSRLTNATYDSGLILVSENRGVIFWVADED